MAQHTGDEKHSTSAQLNHERLEWMPSGGRKGKQRHCCRNGADAASLEHEERGTEGECGSGGSDTKFHALCRDQQKEAGAWKANVSHRKAE